MRWLLPVILVLVVASATPAAARKWSSRLDGFSVEAELVDVREGNAVLKKADGTEVTVPLSTLSLADIRYVQGELKSAEAAMGVKPEGQVSSSKPAASIPPGGEASHGKSEPAAAKPAQTKSPLRYDWKPGQTFTYRVSTQVQLGTGSEEVQGKIHYAVKSVGPEGVAEIIFKENLTRFQKGGETSTSRYPASSAPLHSPHLRYRYAGRSATGSISGIPEVVKVDRYGQIVSMAGGSDFPYFLGRVAYLPFEPLARVDENPWAVAKEIAFRMSLVDWLPDSFLASTGREELPGREKWLFTIESTEGQQISVSQTYEASSVALVDDKSRLALGGEGKAVFDSQRGLFSSSRTKLRVVIHKDDVLTEAAVQVNYELIGQAGETEQKEPGKPTPTP